MVEPVVNKPILSTPWWAWLFVAACLAIPIITLGGALPGAIGGGGAAACYSLSRAEKYSLKIRLASCFAILLLCWSLFGGFLFVLRQWSA